MKKQYDFQKERKIFALVMFIVLALIMLAGVLEVYGVFRNQEEPEWKPTVIYPMVNANISWKQSFHPGGWT